MRTRIISLMTVFLCYCNGHNNIDNVTQQKATIKSETILGFHAAAKNGELAKGTLASKGVFKYNEKGELVEANYYDLKTNSIFSKDKRVYDGNGNMIEIIFYDRAGETGRYVFKFDSKNHEIEKMTYWKGRLDGKVITSYDYKNMIVKVSDYNAEGNLQSVDSYKVDEKGNHLEDYETDGKILSKSTYQYDVKGRIEKENWESWEEGHGQGIVKLKYDEQDNEVKRINMDKGGKLISTNKTEYVYDKFGNWTTKVVTWSWLPNRETTKRELEYYGK